MQPASNQFRSQGISSESIIELKGLVRDIHQDFKFNSLGKYGIGDDYTRMFPLIQKANLTRYHARFLNLFIQVRNDARNIYTRREVKLRTIPNHLKLRNTAILKNWSNLIVKLEAALSHTNQHRDEARFINSASAEYQDIPRIFNKHHIQEALLQIIERKRTSNSNSRKVREIAELAKDTKRHYYISYELEKFNDSFFDIVNNTELGNRMKSIPENTIICVLLEAYRIKSNPFDNDVEIQFIIASSGAVLSSNINTFDHFSPKSLDFRCDLFFQITLDFFRDNGICKEIHICCRGIHKELQGHKNMKAVSLSLFNAMSGIISTGGKKPTMMVNRSIHIATAKWMACSARRTQEIMKETSIYMELDGSLFPPINFEGRAGDIIRYQSDIFLERFPRNAPVV